MISFSLKNTKTLQVLLIIFLCISSYFLLPDFLTEPQRWTIFTFILAIGFWSLEIIPLYATSLLIIVFLTLILTKADGLLNLDAMGYKLFLTPFSSPVIMLFLGGFVLAKAVQKHDIDVFIMRKFLKHLKKKPFFILFGFLFLSAFFSMWLSNTATAAMMISLITPVLKKIKSDDPFRKALILATAFGANIGGVITPIGTPPNAIAIGILAENGVFLNFLGWIVMALPLAIVVLLFTGFFLLWLFPPKVKKLSFEFPQEAPLTKMGTGTILIAALMIFFWLTNTLHHIPEAVVSLVGVSLFASFMIIDVEDIKSINWDILILMWGGLVLGQAIQSSELATQFLQTPFFEKYTFGLIALFCFVAIILSSFISNTAAANLLLPIAISLPGHGKILLSITIALSCSFGMGFPVSTPPNAIAYSTRFLKTKDFLKSGGVISIIAVIIVLLGFEYVILNIF
ncbi:MAG: DASS family sodium-coupled anion symporter [Chlamydiota bacterium]|jgi:sodium-dependent dicarboxylate transporter 2/3/5